MDRKVGVIGLGYVGLPLAVEFGKQFETVGFDINGKRIEELRRGVDRTRELSAEQMAESSLIRYTDRIEELATCDFYVVTVPTPIDRHNRPDLTPLLRASETVGKILKAGDIVVFESTVYPGCTEDDCVPILERHSGLKFNVEFHCGYSPERINPGDKEHTVSKIRKVTSGSSPDSAEIIDQVYGRIITAGTFKASSIKVAEAAKVIENSQRDINIAFVNELSLIFERIGIDTLEVLEAAGTKWNFLPFRPGLVGGHCIGVDPFYLTHKAESLGYHPEVILSGRRINDSMPQLVANKVVKLMIRKGHRIDTSRILVLGVTFKENCPDIRNSKAAAVVAELREFGCSVDVLDPWADPEEVQHEYGFTSTRDIRQLQSRYEAVVLLVAHTGFLEVAIDSLVGSDSVIFDVKGVLPKSMVTARL